MLKCCPGSRLGYERKREEGDQSAGVSPRAELGPGGVGGLSMGGKWSWWTSGVQLEKRTRTLAGSFQGLRRADGRWDGTPRLRRDDRAVGLTGRAGTKPKRAALGNDMRDVAMICRVGSVSARGVGSWRWEARDGRLGEARVCVDQMQIVWNRGRRRGGHFRYGASQAEVEQLRWWREEERAVYVRDMTAGAPPGICRALLARKAARQGLPACKLSSSVCSSASLRLAAGRVAFGQAKRTAPNSPTLAVLRASSPRTPAHCSEPVVRRRRASLCVPLARAIQDWMARMPPMPAITAWASGQGHKLQHAAR